MKRAIGNGVGGEEAGSVGPGSPLAQGRTVGIGCVGGAGVNGGARVRCESRLERCKKLVK